LVTVVHHDAVLHWHHEGRMVGRAGRLRLANQPAWAGPLAQAKWIVSFGSIQCTQAMARGVV
jgi:hypothetical protein